MSASSPTATASVERPTGPPREALADGREDLAVQPVEALVVDLEQVERGVGGRGVDRAGAADLGVVAHALEQPVGDARRAAGALGDRARALPASISTPSTRAERVTMRAEVVGRVVLEPVLDAEAVAQRRRQQARRGSSRRSA